MLQEGGHPIMLNASENAGKTTMTAGAVRKIAGIKRGPPRRTVDRSNADAQPLTRPTQLQTDLEHASTEQQHALVPEPPAVGATGPTEESIPPPEEAGSDSFEADFSGMFLRCG